MMYVIIAGVLFIIAGAFVTGTGMNRKLELRSGKSFLIRKIMGNLGGIFFVAGILCIVAGVANLYYG